jgi:drug/metabolite transporter (DMT)-like permease
MPHAFLILAVCALGLLGVLHKVADFRGCRPEAINVFLFLGAAGAMWAVSFLRFGGAALSGLPPAVIGVGVICGLLASTAILNFQHGVRYGRISTSWLIVNLSTALPAVLSILIYRERLGARRSAGLVLALVALLLLWLERRREEAQSLPAVVNQDVGA